MFADLIHTKFYCLFYRITSLRREAMSQAAQPRHDPELAAAVEALKRDNDEIKRKLLEEFNAHKVDQDVAEQLIADMRKEVETLQVWSIPKKRRFYGLCLTSVTGQHNHFEPGKDGIRSRGMTEALVSRYNTN